jgi:hypothetical protein
MKVSGTGAAVGALVGCLARGSVVLLNLGNAAEMAPAVALPSAGIGVLVGALAGAVGRPLAGAAVGAVLSGVVFELFMCACASLVGTLNSKAGEVFLSQTLIYALEMAVAGAVAGGVGGLAGKAAKAARSPGPPVGSNPYPETSQKERPGRTGEPSEGIQDFLSHPGAGEDQPHN